MVKQEVCQLVIKLFSPSLKVCLLSPLYSLVQPASSRSSLAGLPSEKPYFPIAMRLVRVVVVLLTNYHQILVRFGFKGENYEFSRRNARYSCRI